MNLSKDELQTIADMLAKIGIPGTPTAVQRALRHDQPASPVKTFLRRRP